MTSPAGRFRRLGSWAALACVVGASGCVGPVRDPVADNVRAGFIQQYGAPGALPRAASRAERNEFIDRYLAVKNLQYYNYVTALRRGTGYSELGADAGRLVLDGLATLTGGVGLKAALAGASAGITGITGAVKKDLFFDRAISVFVIKMEELRAAKLADIVRKKKLPLEDYTITEAFNDVQDYAQAGSLDAALVALNTSTGQMANNAKVELAVAKRDDTTAAVLSSSTAVLNSSAPVLPDLGKPRPKPTKPVTKRSAEEEVIETVRGDIYDMEDDLSTPEEKAAFRVAVLNEPGTTTPVSAKEFTNVLDRERSLERIVKLREKARAFKPITPANPATPGGTPR